MSSKGTAIETFKDLKSFFYDGLSTLNKKSLIPVGDEVVIYSSEVLEKYSLNCEIFRKALGLNFLEAQLIESHERNRVYKDVGDSALMLVGYFSQSINTKLISKSYYIKIGQMAYSKVDNNFPDYLDIPGFYKSLADSFEGLTHLLKAFSQNNTQDPLRHLFLDSEDNNSLLVNGVTPNSSKVAS